MITRSRHQEIPSVTLTGHGYAYTRSRYDGEDETVYLHQLCAIAGGADPEWVFSELTDIHHRPFDEWLDLDEDVPAAPIEVGDMLIPAIDTPESVEVQLRWDHREENLRGGDDE